MENYLYYDLNYPERVGPFLEQWKEIKNYESLYWVSDYGRIKSHKRGILKCNRDGTGYVGVNLQNKGNNRRVSVHILVCEHFIPNILNKPCVNHKLGFKHQNFVHELEWCTHQENIIHAFKVLKRYTNPNDHRKNIIYIHHPNGQITKALGIRKTARMLNIPYQGIQGCLRGKLRIYKGYFFTQDIEYVSPENKTGFKICNKCRIEKSKDKFHKLILGVVSTCKVCRNEYLRLKRIKDKSK